MSDNLKMEVLSNHREKMGIVAVVVVVICARVVAVVVIGYGEVATGQEEEVVAVGYVSVSVVDRAVVAVDGCDVIADSKAVKRA